MEMILAFIMQRGESLPSIKEVKSTVMNILYIKFFQAPPWDSAYVKYVLLTKPVVKMTGYWPNCFFICLRFLY